MKMNNCLSLPPAWESTQIYRGYFRRNEKGAVISTFIKMAFFNSLWFSLALLLWGCSLPGISPGPVATQQIVSQPSTGGWQAEWEKAVAEAKKEGSLIVYSGAGPELRVMVAPLLEQKYGIKMELISGMGSAISAKLLRERKAGIYLGDIYISGATTSITTLKPGGVFDVIEPYVILPEALEPKSWYGGGIRYIDKEHYILQTSAYPSSSLVINLDYTKPEEISSYRDLLNPKFKGKIVLTDPTTGGSGGKFFGIVGSKIMGFDFMRELAKQEPQISRDGRLQTEWLARGKSLIQIGPYSEVIAEFQKTGIPLKYVVPSEGTYLTSGYGTMSLINKARNPNAAKVFINWILTQEGSTLLAKGIGAQSARVDVPTDFLDSARIRDPQTKYISGDDEEYLMKEPEYYILAREIFAQQLK